VKREAGGDRSKTVAPAKTRKQSMKVGLGNQAAQTCLHLHLLYHYDQSDYLTCATG
jgi:hypothetical protein